MEKRPAHNSTYKKLAIQWLNEHLCFVVSLVVADSLRLRNRQPLVAAKRYVQAENKQNMKLLIAFTLFVSSFEIMGQNFHTEFKYDDSLNKGISIQNSYPKGGQKYTAPNGKEYIYLVFWTCIKNETDSDLALSIEFPIEPFTVPSSPEVNFNLYLPIEEMAQNKEPLFSYGLDLKLFLDKNIEKSPELIKTIKPNESYSFYVVALSNKGVDGVVRAGFELQKEKLIYKINNHEINCGRIISIK